MTIATVKKQPSIDLLRLRPRSHTRPIPRIHPFTLIRPIPIIPPSMRKGPGAIHRSIEPTAVESILDSPNRISVLFPVQPRPLFFDSAIWDYTSQRQGGDDRLVDELKGEDCETQYWTR